MLKKTMICAFMLFIAQSTTLFAAQDNNKTSSPNTDVSSELNTDETSTLPATDSLDKTENELPETSNLITKGTIDSDTQPTENEKKLGADDTLDSSPESAESNDNELTLNEKVQNLKQQVLELNKDLFILEEELLFPTNTQVAVFVSMDVGDFFQLDAVKLTIDENVVSNYLYTDKQVDALIRGGVQRLYLGNLKTGEHEIVAVFTGRGPKLRDYRRATTLKFEKTSQVKNIELKIVDSTASQQPEFVVKEW